MTDFDGSLTGDDFSPDNAALEAQAQNPAVTGFIVPTGTPGVTSQSPDGTINLAPVVATAKPFDWKMIAVLAAVGIGAYLLLRKR